jgi:hypothetical protein
VATALQKPQTVRFTAKGQLGLRQIVEPQHARYDSQGKVIPIQGTGKTIEFVPDGHGAQFYETADPDEIKFLRERIADPMRPASYFELPPVVPSAGPVMAQIAKLAATRDVDGLAKLYREESENWARKEVLETIESVSDALTPEK